MPFETKHKPSSCGAQGIFDISDMPKKLIIDTDGDQVIGIPGNEFQQTYVDSCAIKSQQIILNEFGVPVTEDQCVQYSYEHGWYNGSGEGTSFEDVGKLLNDGGISTHQQINADVFDIMSELSQGHKIIVGVDSGELWGNSFIEWLRDFFLGDTPDHAIIVSGIDTSDPNNIMVYVTDPGNGDHNKAYPLDQFMDAWKDAQCFMVATDDPVPSSSLAMENFDYGIGHIPQVAGLDYTDFQIFCDISDSIPIYDHSFDTPISPMASLVDAYLDVSTEQIPFQGIFIDYTFNNYLDTDIVNQAMVDTYNNSINQINFTPELSWDSYADTNGYDMLNNAYYEDFLHNSIDYFNAVGDYNSALYCEQQLHILDYCDSCDVDFYNTFYNI